MLVLGENCTALFASCQLVADDIFSYLLYSCMIPVRKKKLFQNIWVLEVASRTVRRLVLVRYFDKKISYNYIV